MNKIVIVKDRMGIIEDEKVCIGCLVSGGSGQWGGNENQNFIFELKSNSLTKGT